jgi:hypothetical protein
VPIVSVALLVAAPFALLVTSLSGIAWPIRLIISVALLAAAVACWPLLRREVTNPVAGPVRISDADATRVFTALHRNLYRALEFHQESEIYDALAFSVHGDLLRETYLNMRKGLEMQEQGGAVARVRQVDMLEGHVGPPPSIQSNASPDEQGFTYRCRWNVAGTVEHWGHIHERTNQYEAVFTVEPIDTAWKVTDIEPIDEQRVKTETRLRTL